MSRALSLDLRLRAIAAVDAGMTHRAAAERFGVSAASISRWRGIARAVGEPRAGPLGGDRRSGRVEAAAPAILAALEATPDATINELRTTLAADGLSFGFGTIQRFFRRHRITRKKRPRTPPSRAVPTS
jgi:transposase